MNKQNNDLATKGKLVKQPAATAQNLTTNGKKVSE